MSAIAVEQVSKRWGETTAVDNISFTAREGQFTVLLGPSGCGKSTTLRLIAGLEDVSGGRITIGGKDVTDRPPAERDLSMVFQSYALFPHLNVAENILFGLKVRRVSKADRDRRLQRAAALLGLSELLGRRPSQLSGGQQQRVALGRAIIAEKPVCLMDEPLSNLDAKLRHEMRQEIRQLQRSLGISMVYVTHDQAEAMSMADQVVLLNNGRIEQHAAPEKIYRRPASEFVARFIGTPPMNIVTIDDPAEIEAIPGLEGLIGRVDRPVHFGVRPEDIRFSDHDGIAAEVRDLEYLGADSIVDCDLAGQVLSVRTDGRAEIAAGTRVRLIWPPDCTHLFDAENGHRRDELHGREVGDLDNRRQGVREKSQ